MKINRIKSILEKKGVSQTWLAKQLDKSFNTINSYVCNRSQPNLETLLQISKILDVDIKDLILQKEEVSDAKYFSKDEIINRINNNYEGLTEKEVSWSIFKKIFESNIV